MHCSHGYTLLSVNKSYNNSISTQLVQLVLAHNKQICLLFLLSPSPWEHTHPCHFYFPERGVGRRRSGKGWGGVGRRGEEELALERSSKARDLVCCASSLVLWRDSSSDWSSPQRTSSSSFSSCSCFRCDSFRSRAIFRRCVLKGMRRRKIDTVPHTLLSVDACVCMCGMCGMCGVCGVCSVCMCGVCACVHMYVQCVGYLLMTHTAYKFRPY